MAQRRFWSLRPATAREAVDAVWANLLLHWFPVRMRTSSLAWVPTFWLGSVTWVLFLLLLLSGLPLMVSTSRQSGTRTAPSKTSSTSSRSAGGSGPCTGSART